MENACLCDHFVILLGHCVCVCVLKATGKYLSLELEKVKKQSVAHPDVTHPGQQNILTKHSYLFSDSL